MQSHLLIIIFLLIVGDFRKPTVSEGISGILRKNNFLETTIFRTPANGAWPANGLFLKRYFLSYVLVFTYEFCILRRFHLRWKETQVSRRSLPILETWYRYKDMREVLNKKNSKETQRDHKRPYHRPTPTQWPRYHIIWQRLPVYIQLIML